MPSRGDRGAGPSRRSRVIVWMRLTNQPGAFGVPGSRSSTRRADLLQPAISPCRCLPDEPVRVSPPARNAQADAARAAAPPVKARAARPAHSRLVRPSASPSGGCLSPSGDAWVGSRNTCGTTGSRSASRLSISSATSSARSAHSGANIAAPPAFDSCLPGSDWCRKARTDDYPAGMKSAMRTRKPRFP